MRTLQELYRQLGEDMLTLLPEMIPFLAEVLEVCPSVHPPSPVTLSLACQRGLDSGPWAWRLTAAASRLDFRVCCLAFLPTSSLLARQDPDPEVETACAEFKAEIEEMSGEDLAEYLVS